MATSSRQQQTALTRLPVAKTLVSKKTDTKPHSNSPYAPTIRFNGQGYFYYPTNFVFEPRYRQKAALEHEREVPKVMAAYTTKVAYSGVRL